MMPMLFLKVIAWLVLLNGGRGEALAQTIPLQQTKPLTYTCYLPIIQVPFAERIAFAAEGGIYVMSTDGQGVRTITKRGEDGGMPDWSPDGQFLVFDSLRDGNGEIYTMRANGSEQTNITKHPAQDGQPAWSRDGHRIAFATKRDGNREIYTMRPDGSDLIRVTNHPADDATPTWSPDGSKIAFASDRDGRDGIYIINSDGSGDAVRLSELVGWAPAWSPDGSTIAFESYQSGNGNIYVAAVDQMTPPILLTDHPANDLDPDWSADGTQIIFSSNRNGGYNLYQVATSGGEASALTSGFTDAHYPSWSWPARVRSETRENDSGFHNK